MSLPFSTKLENLYGDLEVLLKKGNEVMTRSFSRCLEMQGKQTNHLGFALKVIRSHNDTFYSNFIFAVLENHRRSRNGARGGSRRPVSLFRV